MKNLASRKQSVKYSRSDSSNGTPKASQPFSRLGQPGTEGTVPSPAALRHLFENAPCAMSCIDANGRIGWANSVELRLFGYSVEEYIGHHIEEFLVNPSSVAQILTCLTRKKSFEDLEVQVRCKNGSSKTVLVNGEVFTGDGNSELHCFTREATANPSSSSRSSSKVAYRKLIENLAAAVYMTDSQGKITFFNQRAIELWGRAPEAGEEVWGGALRMLKADGSPLGLEESPTAKALRGRRPVRGQEIVIVRPDGTRTPVLLHPDPLYDDSGKLIGAVNLLVELGELHRKERALRASERRLTQLMGLMPAAVYTCDREGRITYYNDRAAELWKRKPPIQSDHWKFCAAYKCWVDGKVLSPEETPMAIAVREGKQFRDLDPIFERPDGTKFHALVNIDPLFDEEGNPAGAINVFQDITAFKNAEQQLRSNEERLRAALHASGTGTFRWDIGTGTLEWDEALDRLFGCAEGETVRTLSEFIQRVHPEDRDAVSQACKESATYGIDFSLEFRILHANGTIRWLDDRGKTFFDGNGKPIYMTGACVDITHRKQAEAHLRTQKQVLEQMVRGASLPEILETITSSVEQRLDRTSLASILLLKEDRLYPAAGSSIPNEWSRYIAGMKIGPMAGACGAAAYTKKPVAVISMEKDPRTQQFRKEAVKHGFRSCCSFPILSSQNGVLGSFAIYQFREGDLSEHDWHIIELLAKTAALAIERKHDEELIRSREEALRQSEAEFRLLAESMPQMVWTSGADGYMDYANSKWFEYTGLSAAQTLGDGWEQTLHADDLPKCRERWQKSVHSGELYEVECRFRRYDATYRWHISRATPVRDEQGRIVKWFGTCTDIEDQKRAAERLEAAVAERTHSLQQALSQLEEFSYSVSHDLRAPLRGIEGFSQMLLEECDSKLSDEAKLYLSRISRNVGRMKQLIGDLLALSRVASIEVNLRRTAVGPVVEEIIQQNPQLQLPHAIVEVQPLEDVMAQELFLHQVLSNLLANAVKFARPGVRPHIRIWTEKQDQVVRLYVADNGLGIAPEFQSKVFGLFQRLHQDHQYEGTGIGLAIVRKCVERMGGRVGLVSDGQSGSTFWVELKRA